MEGLGIDNTLVICLRAALDSGIASEVPYKRAVHLLQQCSILPVQKRLAVHIMNTSDRRTQISTASLPKTRIDATKIIHRAWPYMAYTLMVNKPKMVLKILLDKKHAKIAGRTACSYHSDDTTYVMKAFPHRATGDPALELHQSKEHSRLVTLQ